MNRRKLLTFILLMVSTIFLYGSVVGQSPSQRTDIAEISNNGSNVSWLIKVPNEGGVLKVSTPSGEVFQREFKSGSIINFSPTNERGEFYGNGQYTYEIVLTPVLSPKVKEAMAQSRVNDNSAEVANELRKRGSLPAEMTQSGTFTFNNGNLFMGDGFDKEPENFVRQSQPNVETKTPATKTPTTQNAGDIPVDNAQVITQDLVVQGSTCTGFDCVNGENFGFDTLRLKENNLRIRFFDTSNSSSFPTNDWELTANDTSNGGQNRFSITDIDAGRAPFTIEAGAAVNSLYVDSTSRIGFKTATPVVELHVRDGDSPTLRLEQDGSSGFTAQTWDIAGNEANFFIRDVTNGSRLPFKIRPGAATDSFVIENNGDITIKNNLRVAGADSATYLFGGSGAIAPQNVANATVDLTNNAVGPTNGVQADVNVSYNIPPSPNLAATNLNNIEYVVRYRDSDGTGNANSRVRISVFSVDAATGLLQSNQFFDSNNFAPTADNTVTVCGAVPANFYTFGTRGMFMNALIQNRSAVGQTQLFYVRIKRVASC